jgi:hypothetical protein
MNRNDPFLYYNVVMHLLLWAECAVERCSSFSILKGQFKVLTCACALTLVMDGCFLEHCIGRTYSQVRDRILGLLGSFLILVFSKQTESTSSATYIFLNTNLHNNLSILWLVNISQHVFNK